MFIFFKILKKNCILSFISLSFRLVYCKFPTQKTANSCAAMGKRWYILLHDLHYFIIHTASGKTIRPKVDYMYRQLILTLW